MPGEVHEYTFSGAAGDIIWVSATTTGGSGFIAKAVLIRPDGTVHGSTTDRMQVTLPTSGIYTLQVSDGSAGAPDPGTYVLGVEWVYPVAKQCAGTTAPISCGTPASATLPDNGQDLYTFSGAAGDIIWVSATTTGGSGFIAKAVLFRPDGTVHGSTTDRMQVTLPTSGIYTLQVSDGSAGAPDPGTYVLGVEWVFPVAKQCAGTTAPITCGTPTSATLPDNGQDLYTFSGAAGDIVSVSVTTTGGSGFIAEVVLRDPIGTPRGSTTSMMERTLPTTGTYTLQVFDGSAGAPDPGMYTLSWGIVGKPCPAVDLILTIDGGPTSTRPRGETFVFGGSGFTPGGSVNRFVSGPSGTETLEPSLSADEDGMIGWTFTPTCGSAIGSYTVWAVDAATSLQSNQVTEVVTANESCASIVLRFPLATFGSSTAPLSSVFDHSMQRAYASDGVVTAFDQTRTERRFGPGTLTAVVGDRRIQLSWTGAVGAASYKLVGKQSSKFPVIGNLCNPASGETVLHNGPGTSVTHEGLTNGLKYSYRLCVVEGDGAVNAGLQVAAIPSPTAATKRGTDACNAFKRVDGAVIALPPASYVGATSCGRRNYLTYDGHPGIDVAVPYGTPVYAAISGRVSYITPASSVSNPAKFHLLLIEPLDGSGYQVLYLHLSSYWDASTGTVKRRHSNGTVEECTECPREGALVDADATTPIGYVGNFQGGWAKVSPHLHIEVAKDGVPVDPYGWRGAGADPYTNAGNLTLWDDLPPPVPPTP